MAITSPIIVALDFADADQAYSLAKELDPKKCRVKVGKELFTRAGPSIIESLHKLGFEIFLDLKFHDIPNTVAGACRAAAELGCWMINVHASGGTAMLEAATTALSTLSKPPLLIAVTVLTSLDDSALQNIGFDSDTQNLTQHLARLAQQAGIDGVVSSAHDIVATKQNLGDDFLVVTPGIRPAGSATGDQARIATPRSAVSSGADYLVIGRPITQAERPLVALEAILADIEVV